MPQSRRSSILHCLFVLTISASFGRTQTVQAPPQEQIAPLATKTDRPAYPLVVRIDHTAFDVLTTNAIDQRSHVDKVVLGTHAVGESRTRAAISVLLTPDRDEATFDIRCRGRTQSRTVGVNGPALIYSHTDTDFMCTRPITFDPSQGFVAGPTAIVARTNLTYDGFGSSGGRIGRRIVSRVAERRSSDSWEQARRIAARDTENELRSSFDNRVNIQLAAMNQKYGVVRYKDLFLGKGLDVQLAARSSQDCIHIGFSREMSPARLTVLPPRRETAAPIEIWVHSTLLGDSVNKLLSPGGNNAVLPPASRLELLATLLIPPEESARLMGLGVYDGWIVFDWQNEIANRTATVITK